MKGEKRLSRRTLLRGLAGVAGAGAVSTTLSGCASANTAAISSATSSTYRSLSNFRPPPIVIGVRPSGTAPGVVLVDCHGGVGQQGPMIIGANGELVWFKPVSDHGTPVLRAMNLRVQKYRGKPVLTWFEGHVVSGHGQGHYVIADTSYRQIATVQAAHGLTGDLHEFFITAAGTAIFSVYGTATANLTSVGGAHAGPYYYGEVQEIDLASGKLLFSWRTDQHVSFNESHEALPANAAQPWDYFHLNSMAIDPSDGNLIISSRDTWTIYKVHRTSGAIMWRLGGKKSDFTMGPGTNFAFQHHVTPYAGGLYTIFDNEGAPFIKPPSRGLILQVDEVKRTATFVRQFLHSPSDMSGSSGSVSILPNGNFFMGWGTSTYFSEYDPSGKLIFDGHLSGAKIISYRAFKQPWTAQPSSPPAIAAERTPSTTLVFASWNGATEVASWRVLAGGATGSLKVVGTAPKSGFETRIVIPSRPKRVAVEALDSTAKVLRRSAVKHL